MRTVWTSLWHRQTRIWWLQAAQSDALATIEKWLNYSVGSEYFKIGFDLLGKLSQYPEGYVYGFPDRFMGAGSTVVMEDCRSIDESRAGPRSAPSSQRSISPAACICAVGVAMLTITIIISTSTRHIWRTSSHNPAFLMSLAGRPPYAPP